MLVLDTVYRGYGPRHKACHGSAYCPVTHIQYMHTYTHTPPPPPFPASTLFHPIPSASHHRHSLLSSLDLPYPSLARPLLHTIRPVLYRSACLIPFASPPPPFSPSPRCLSSRDPPQPIRPFYFSQTPLAAALSSSPRQLGSILDRLPSNRSAPPEIQPPASRTSLAGRCWQGFPSSTLTLLKNTSPGFSLKRDFFDPHPRRASHRTTQSSSIGVIRLACLHMPT